MTSRPAYERISHLFTLNADGSATTATVSAPAGYVAIAGGWTEAPNFPIDSYPAADGSSWRFTFGGPGGGYSFTVYVLCVSAL